MIVEHGEARGVGSDLSRPLGQFSIYHKHAPFASVPNQARHGSQTLVFRWNNSFRPDITQLKFWDKTVLWAIIMASNVGADSFEWTGIPGKVIFGAGKIDTLPVILATMNLNRCMILTTPNQQHLGEQVTALISRKAAATFNSATMHTPRHITEQALKVATEAQIDSTVSIGGGSTTGLGKALAIRLGVPQICIPTTYAGSEMTPTLGETVNGQKTTQRNEAIRPNVVIYDVNLTLKLPLQTSLTSGMNAIAHAGE